jgi:hypothetical protein
MCGCAAYEIIRMLENSIQFILYLHIRQTVCYTEFHFYFFFFFFLANILTHVQDTKPHPPHKKKGDM